jgi:hypothetical protein
MGRVQYIVPGCWIEWSRVVERGMGAIDIRPTQRYRTVAVGFQKSVRLDSWMFKPECHSWQASMPNRF